MEKKDPQIESKKRSLETMHASELLYKLKSKEDFYVYLDKHRKSLSFPLTYFYKQSSTTCRRRTKSTKTS